jgi:hypothetical protein
MHTALLRREPWATIQWDSAEARELPTFRVENLSELPRLCIPLQRCTAMSPV